jgi:hypothetical protein
MEQPQAPDSRELKDQWIKYRASKQDKWEALSPVNDRIIDGMLCEPFKRKRNENKI